MAGILKGNQAVQLNSAGETDAPSEVCAASVTPALLGLVSIGASCGDANATTAGSSYNALATGNVAEIGVGPGGLLNQLGLGATLTNLETTLSNTLGSALQAVPGASTSSNSVPVQGAIQTATSTVDGLLSSGSSATGGLLAPVTNLVSGLVGGVVNALPGASSGSVGLTSVVGGVTNGVLGLLSQSGLLAISLGQTTSTVASSGSNSLTATAHADAGYIKLLPSLSGNGALVTIDLPAASATASEPSAGATPTAAVSPYVVKVIVSLPGQSPTTIEVDPGTSENILGLLTISVGSGSTSVGSSSAMAQGQGVDITGLGGLINLDLASVKASVSTPAAKVTTSPTTPTTPTTTTPTTSPTTTTPTTTTVTTTPTARPVSQVTPVTQATSVHTGEPWSGAWPYLGGGLAFGAGLLNWQRIRRLLGR